LGPGFKNKKNVVRVRNWPWPLGERASIVVRFEGFFYLSNGTSFIGQKKCPLAPWKRYSFLI
jgi:hypothetical protein